MRKNYSVLMRSWHWLNAIVVIGLLGTFFLRKTFLSWKTNAALITEKLGAYGIDVTEKQAAAIARAIRAPMWEWHIILGVALGILLLVRVWILWSEKGFGYEENGSLHTRLVHWGYKALYLVLAFMAVSGIMIHWDDALGVSHSIVESLEGIHESVAWAVVYFVPLHILGVVIAEHRGQKNLTSKMISG